MRRFGIIAAAAAVLFTSVSAMAAGGGEKPKQLDWPHGGPFGTFDRAALQRGMQVYREVCSGCHSLRLVAFRTLADIGLSEAEIKAIAAQVTVVDGPNDDGDMFERAGKPSDYFPSPFANDNAARASNGGALPPDLSLIVKARPGGENYIYSILTGYGEPPAGVEVAEGMNYNAYFPGHQIAMAPPLSEGAVEYADGTEASVDQMARDVTTFLTWASEPSLEQRRSIGIKVILFLLVFAGVLFAAKRKIWSDVH
jgi:ubiquinol-cytochrome c reductase cytochrome c1 subunit